MVVTSPIRRRIGRETSFDNRLDTSSQEGFKFPWHHRPPRATYGKSPRGFTDRLALPTVAYPPRGRPMKVTMRISQRYFRNYTPFLTVAMMTKSIRSAKR